jgi:uncharacterized protein (DUF362 family)
MFGRYTMMEELLDTDEIVSVAMIKNHAFTGVTSRLNICLASWRAKEEVILLLFIARWNVQVD